MSYLFTYRLQPSREHNHCVPTVCHISIKYGRLEPKKKNIFEMRYQWRRKVPKSVCVGGGGGGGHTDT